MYREEEGLAIQCDECKDWSHVACQRDSLREGRASNLSVKDKFICDVCDIQGLLPKKDGARRSERK